MASRKITEIYAYFNYPRLWHSNKPTLLQNLGYRLSRCITLHFEGLKPNTFPYKPNTFPYNLELFDIVNVIYNYKQMARYIIDIYINFNQIARFVKNRKFGLKFGSKTVCSAYFCPKKAIYPEGSNLVPHTVFDRQLLCMDTYTRTMMVGSSPILGSVLLVARAFRQVFQLAFSCLNARFAPR